MIKWWNRKGETGKGGDIDLGMKAKVNVLIVSHSSLVAYRNHQARQLLRCESRFFSVCHVYTL
jgi:hypothetical protein